MTWLRSSTISSVAATQAVARPWYLEPSNVNGAARSLSETPRFSAGRSPTLTWTDWLSSPRRSHSKISIDATHSHRPAGQDTPRVGAHPRAGAPAHDPSHRGADHQQHPRPVNRGSGRPGKRA